MKSAKFGFLTPLLAGFFVALSVVAPADAQRKLPREALDGYLELPNFASQATTIISSGAATPLRAANALAAETGTADDLDTVVISAWQAGDQITVVADTGDTITLKHGTGNITTDTGEDIILIGAARATLYVTASGVDASQGGGGAGVGEVADLTALQARNINALTAGDLVTVSDPLRGGVFRWDASDLSTECGYDDGATAGIYFKPTSAANCTTGAWVRVQYLEDGRIKPEWWGAITDDGLTDTANFQAMVDFADDVVTAGIVTGPAIAVDLKANAEYYFATGVTIPSTLDGITFWGAADGQGAYFTTDQNIVMFMVGADLSGGGDKAGADSIWDVGFHNINFRNTAAAGNAVALQLNFTRRTHIYNCTFSDFYIALDGYRFSFAWVENNWFEINNRTDAAPAIALVRLQGVYDSTNVNTPGGNIHWSNNEMRGRSDDPDSLATVWKVQAVDGLFIYGGHAQFYERYLDVAPDGTDQNNRITDIRIFDHYFDDPGEGGTTIYLGGTIDGSKAGGGLYQRIHIFDSLFRASYDGQNAIYVSVQGTNGFDSLKDITVTDSEFAQHTSTAISLDGSGESRLEVENFALDGNTFFLNNQGGAAASGSLNIEAKSVIITDNRFAADFNAATRIGAIDVSGGAGTSCQIVGNNYTDTNATDTNRLMWVTGASGAVCEVRGNIHPGAGRLNDEMRVGSTTGEEALILWFDDITSNNNTGYLFYDVVGHSTDTNNRWAAARGRTLVHRNNSAVITQQAATLQYENISIPNNLQPIFAVLLTGTAYSNGMGVAQGDVVVNGGNAYMVINDGDGTVTDATGPTGTTDQQVVDDVRFLYLGAQDTDRLALVVSGAASTAIDWTAHVDFVRSQ